jgi:hypothetical protein
VLSLTQLWGDRQPAVIQRFVDVMQWIGGEQVRPALRFALAEKEGALL